MGAKAMATLSKTQASTKIATPKEYAVMLLNDDYTSMEFVVEVLMGIFAKSFDEAKAIMLRVHNEGRGVCGIYTYEIALTKSDEVKSAAKMASFPLRSIVEEV
jgi:ATP-dependent Clp protease adaptor protein ClpS